jgi:tetratricopeptide (TPR) repeat protein
MKRLLVVLNFLFCAIVCHAQTASDWYSKGFYAVQNKEYQKAVEYYTEAIRLDPSNPNSYNDRGFSKNMLKLLLTVSAHYETEKKRFT